MLYVSATDLSSSDLEMLGNNILPSRRQLQRTHDQRANRRVLAAVNRSLSAMHEGVTRLHPVPAKSFPSSRALAS